MTIESLLKNKDALAKEADRLLAGSAKVDAQLLTRPLMLQQAHVDDLGGRITALETLRADHNARIDAQIAALKADQKRAEASLATARKAFEPVVDREAAAAKTRTGGKGAKVKK